MLISNSNFIKKAVSSLQTGSKIGETIDLMVDPRDLSIPAVFINSPRYKEDAILHTADVRDYNNQNVIVDSVDQIMQTEDLPGIKEIIAFDFGIINLKVVNEDGKKLGKIESYAVLMPGWAIGKIYVKQSVLKSVSSASLIIDRSQVIKVNNDELTVKSTSTKKGVLAKNTI